MQVSTIMTRNLVTISPDTTLSKIRQVFDFAKFQHLPVVDSSQRLVGVLSVKDYFKALVPVLEASETSLNLFLTTKKAKHLMSTPVISVCETFPVSKVAALLLEHNISCVMVTDNDQIALGIVSWKDIMRAVLLYSSRRQQNS